MPIQKEAVYRIDPKSEQSHRRNIQAERALFQPGLLKLYAADTGASHYSEATREIKVWNATAKNTLAGGKTFASMKLETKGKVLEGGADGIRCDKDGNLGQAPVGRVMVLTGCMFSN